MERTNCAPASTRLENPIGKIDTYRGHENCHRPDDRMSIVARGQKNAPIDAATDAMERYAGGEDSAFEELYDFVAPRLHAYLLRRTWDPALTEDLLQQTLLHVHGARRSFTPGGNVMPWVFPIARHLIIDSARKANRETLCIGEIEQLGLAANADCADEVVHARQVASRLDSELARLPEPQRAAFELTNRRGVSLPPTPA